MASFRELTVWQKAFALCIEVHRTSERVPAIEQRGLAAELRKTARSVVCNIAEGQRRASKRDFGHFLDIARGSAAELETQLLIAGTLGYLSAEASRGLLKDLDEVARMLFGLKSSLKAR